MAEPIHDVSEDDLYRTSTQYRLWSYSAESLKSLRAATNEIAAARVRSAVKKAHQKVDGQDSGDEEVDCLTPQEELKLVGFYCSQAMDFADFLEFPTNIKV
jgi:cyclin H